MKNLGNIIKQEDIPRKKDIFEIPYGTILTVPKQMPTPKGYIEWGTSLKAEDYPYLIDVFGTTNIAVKEIDIIMSSNTSSNDLYIDVSGLNEANSSCDETFDNLYKIFDGNENTGYYAGDGVSTTYEANQYNRRLNFKLKGKIITDLYKIGDKITVIKGKYKWRQNNVLDYGTDAFWMNFIPQGAGGSHLNPQYQLQPGEEYNGEFIFAMFLSDFNTNFPEEEKYITVGSWASGAKLLEIKEVKLELPVITDELYIDIPLGWDITNNMGNAVQNKNLKYIMYIGNKEE